tara:strand:- start:3172 stop:4485 length:1314 start_codon:yes stop_codon:yes gene_type:complete
MKKNNQNLSKELFIPVIEQVKDGKYDEALALLDKLLEKNQSEKIIFKLKASIFLKKKDWINSIFYYEKVRNADNNSEVSNNIGIALYNLGKLSEAIIQFQSSVNTNKNFLSGYENLGMTYKLLGKYELSIIFFLEALKLNLYNDRVKNFLIDICNYYDPINNQRYIIDINSQINNLNLFENEKKIIKNSEIFKLFENSEKLLRVNKVNFNYPETQIFRRNKSNLNCKRHLKVFSEHNIIPSFCFNCYKVQITLNSVLDLIKLYFYFNNLKLENNNIRKCIVELRENIKGNYKGYIFTNSIKESEHIVNLLNDEIKSAEINHKGIEIKHGCTEYYEKYQIFKQIDKDNKKEIYLENWADIEKEFDFKNLILEKNKEKVFNSTLNKYNLSDFLIIKNWLLYAKTIGDNSYKEISKFDLKENYLVKILEPQVNLRKEELS